MRTTSNGSSFFFFLFLLSFLLRVCILVLSLSMSIYHTYMKIYIYACLDVLGVFAENIPTFVHNAILSFYFFFFFLLGFYYLNLFFFCVGEEKKILLDLFCCVWWILFFFFFFCWLCCCQLRMTNPFIKHSMLISILYISTHVWKFIYEVCVSCDKYYI